MSEMTEAERNAFDQAVAYYPGHTGAIGVLIVPGERPMFIKSGVDGGPWGGTQRGGIPRGPGEAFTQGGPSQGNIATHVEGHAAAIMWQREFTKGTLVVSAGMCGICSRNLPTALPPGAEVTVVSMDEGRTIVRSPRYAPPSGGGAPPPNPAQGNSSGGRTGAQWAASLGALAGGLQLFQSMATKQSMMNIYYDALDDMERRKNQLDKQRQQSPFECAVVNVYYYIMNDNAPPDVMRLYEYKGIDIGGESLYNSFLLGQNMHGYSVRFDPLMRKPDADSARPEPRQNWQQRYDRLLGSLLTRSGNVADPVASLQFLNGLAMFDILPILRKLKKSEAIAFDKLQQAIDWPSAEGSIGGGRLKAAFMAVRFAENGGGATFGDYLAICSPAKLLPPEQQKDIEAFLGGAAPAAAVMDTPVGRWRVKVRKWVWIYTFDPYGGVTWVDPLNGLNGRGRWTIGKKGMTTTWTPSKTVEVWTLPLSDTAQTGTASMSEGTFPLTAEMIAGSA